MIGDQVITRMQVSAFAFCLSIIPCLDCGAQIFGRRKPTGERQTIEQGGMERVYRIHVPASYDGTEAVPLVLFLHGGGGDADVGSRMGMTPVADQHDFIVVYPEGINKHWNDGRDSVRFREHDAKIDDVAFIQALVESLQEQYKINASKIFTAGASNGGFMSQRLAMEMSDVFAGAGIIIATMGRPLHKSFHPKLPVSMFFMNGTDDPLVPYDGGEVKFEIAPRLQRNQPSRGFCISTDEAVQLWVRRNGLADATPKKETLPDNDKSDDCTVEQTTWSNSKSPTSVVLYRIIGGGHSIPGGPQYLPKKLIGNTCGDFDGLEAMWQFFDKHGRKKQSKKHSTSDHSTE